MTGRLITAAVARRKMGVPRSTFWEIAHAEKISIVRYTAKCVRVFEEEIDALIEKHTVRGRKDMRLLADGRRS